MDGQLIEKVLLNPKSSYTTYQKNTIYIKDPTVITKYTITSNGKILVNTLSSLINDKFIFVSFDERGNEVKFTNKTMVKNRQEIPIYLIEKHKDYIVYYNKYKNNIFYANLKHYKNKIETLPFSKIHSINNFVNAFNLLPNKLKAFYLMKIRHNDKLLFALFRSYVSFYTDKARVQDNVLKLLEQNPKKSKKLYKILVNSKFIKKPKFVVYKIENISHLIDMLKKYEQSFDYKIFSRYGDIATKTRVKKSKLEIIQTIDYDPIFKLVILGNCSIWRIKKEKEKRSKYFLTFKTVEYLSMVENTIYKCMINKKDQNKLKSLHFFVNIEKIPSKWKWTKKKVLYDIYAKQTEFAKLMTSAFSSRSDCVKLNTTCRKNCRFKNEKNGFFIFTDSDKEKCENYCYDAERSCNQNNYQQVSRYMCEAKCVGYDNSNGGLFTRSDHKKCIDSCINNR